MRIGYVSGRFRVYNEGGSFNQEAMNVQVLQERRWAKVLAQCGIFPLCPLANSVHLEGEVDWEPDKWIEGDLSLIRQLEWQYDLILMRPGWDDFPESEGARREYGVARDKNLLIVHGNQGTKAVVEYLNSLGD